MDYSHYSKYRKGANPSSLYFFDGYERQHNFLKEVNLLISEFASAVFLFFTFDTLFGIMFVLKEKESFK